MYLWYFHSMKKVSKCGKNSAHIYLPEDLLDKEILGVILKENPDDNS